MKPESIIRLPGGRVIGPGQPCFIVAEIGNNHQGDMELARAMVREAAQAGAHAVKFQKRDMSAMFTEAGRQAPCSGPNCFGPTYGSHRLALELSIEEMAELKALAESLGLAFFASAWDMPSLRQVIGLGVPLLKIGSADLVNIPLLRKAGASGIPLILSTGMSSQEDVDAAVAELRRFHDDIVLLHCNSTYPCPDELVGLPVMAALAARHGLPVGYSGHERGLGPSVAAVALGACVLERHFTLDRTMRGTDHQASLDPQGLAELVRLVGEAEAAMRLTCKEVAGSELAASLKLRKSIVFARDLPAGHVLTEADLAAKCPGDGVSPIHWDRAVGMTLAAPVRHDEQFRWELALDAKHGGSNAVNVARAAVSD
ncbi:N-acetylneuraminate synthase family protein [Fundidesulfovibrio soli]|uniref:N-acetylneuraminate synthase family protein n=1 Tax=Fundidesulfovibrio soli TaxID=2922716 RepID=UPI001FAE7778|nr:N-acetylneuraminate synthase family protein [Fundidesulfovibrio soli]